MKRGLYCSDGAPQVYCRLLSAPPSAQPQENDPTLALREAEDQRKARIIESLLGLEIIWINGLHRGKICPVEA